MITLRSRYHDFGNKINIALMGVGMAKQYMQDIAAGRADEETVRDASLSCAAAEKALLELDGEMTRLKALTYRIADPDKDVDKYMVDIYAENAGIRILVVDDEEDVCRLVKCFYVKRGFSVDWTASGEEALRKIKGDVPPHIVILDLYLHGGIEGVDVLRCLRSEVPGVRCVVVTCEDDPARRQIVDSLRPDAVLIKPILPAQLDARINGLIPGLRSK